MNGAYSIDFMNASISSIRKNKTLALALTCAYIFEHKYVTIY